MGFTDPLPVAEEVEYRSGPAGRTSGTEPAAGVRHSELIVLLFAAIVFIVSIISPPRLMDDVDAVQAQIARNMLQSGDWVTAHLDGVAYLEKAPLKYWMIAVCMKLFGVHDWAARIPICFSAILLAWLVARMAGWAFGTRASLYAGLAIAVSPGLWLFTRVLIPDVVLTLPIAFAMWAFLRALEPEERRWRVWALASWAAIGAGLLLKGLIAAVFPLGAAFFYLIFSGLWRERGTWRRLSIPAGVAVMLLIAAPWHVLATLRNPPYFDFTMHAEEGSYRGFFWFYFFNEHILRFLNRRWPRDYNTVPRPLFWILHLVWFFPWSIYFPAIRLKGQKTAVLALCWIGFVMIFFTLS